MTFENRQQKESFLKANKKERITTKDLGFDDKQFIEPIYIDQDLTKRKQDLHKKARLFKKEKQYKFLWVKDGNIYLRKNEESKPLMISHEDDLKN